MRKYSQLPTFGNMLQSLDNALPGLCNTLQSWPIICCIWRHNVQFHRRKNAWRKSKSARRGREMLGRAETCSAQKKNSSAEQHCAYKLSIVLMYSIQQMLILIEKSQIGLVAYFGSICAAFGCFTSWLSREGHGDTGPGVGAETKPYCSP